MYIIHIVFWDFSGILKMNSNYIIKDWVYPLVIQHTYRIYTYLTDMNGFILVI